MFEPVSQKTWEQFFEEQNKVNPFISYGNAKDLKVEDFASSLLPTRSTHRSAGYDFRSPIDMVVRPTDDILVIPTGFKWNPEDSITRMTEKSTEIKYDKPITSVRQYRMYLQNTYLALYPRSSLGLAYGFRLMNTTGVIDADYYNNPYNEGHILVAIQVERELQLKAGNKFCQGVVQIYGQCELEEDVRTSRQGGFGSTGK